MQRLDNGWGVGPPLHRHLLPVPVEHGAATEVRPPLPGHSDRRRNRLQHASLLQRLNYSIHSPNPAMQYVKAMMVFSSSVMVTA